MGVWQLLARSGPIEAACASNPLTRKWDVTSSFSLFLSSSCTFQGIWGLCGPAPGDRRLSGKDDTLLINLYNEGFPKNQVQVQDWELFYRKSYLLCWNKKSGLAWRLPLAGSAPWWRLRFWAGERFNVLQSRNWAGSDFSCNSLGPSNARERCWAAVYTISAFTSIAHDFSFPWHWHWMPQILRGTHLAPPQVCYQGQDLRDAHSLWALLQLDTSLAGYILIILPRLQPLLVFCSTLPLAFCPTKSSAPLVRWISKAVLCVLTFLLACHLKHAAHIPWTACIIQITVRQFHFCRLTGNFHNHQLL